MNPSFGNRQRLARFVVRRKEPAPAPCDFLIRPALGDIGIEPQENVQVIRPFV